MPNTSFRSPPVAITPEMEAFFIAIMLDHGTAPSPELYGFDRHNLASQIAQLMDGHPALPHSALKVKRSIYEMGRMTRNRYSSDDWVYFTLTLADAYLNWLYAAGRLRDQRMGG